MSITLTLELNEVNAVLDAIGQLPTHTNTWPVAAKIRVQAEQQLKQQGDGDGRGDPGAQAGDAA